MYSEIMILRFPKDVVHKPLVCNLVRDYDLTFNILYVYENGEFVK